MEERNEPVECDRAGDTFDHLALGHRRALDELVADEVGQQKLVGARTGQIVVEVVLRGENVVHYADESSGGGGSERAFGTRNRVQCPIRASERVSGGVRFVGRVAGAMVKS